MHGRIVQKQEASVVEAIVLGSVATPSAYVEMMVTAILAQLIKCTIHIENWYIIKITDGNFFKRALQVPKLTKFDC